MHLRLILQFSVFTQLYLSLRHKFLNRMDVKTAEAYLLNLSKSAPRHNEFGQPVGDLMPNWIPRHLPAKTNIEGNYVRIEPLDPERHTDDLWAAFNNGDGRDCTYLLNDYISDLPSFQQFIKRLASSEDPMHHAVISLATGKAVGRASFMRIDVKSGSIEIGNIHFSSLLKKTPQATEAVYLMARRAFDELEYRRFEWKCDSLNAPSISAALRYGFQFEGIFRNALVYKGRSRDTAWFAMTDYEWPAIRKAFQTWLDPSNFDSDGQQKLRLGDFTAAARQVLQKSA